MTGHRPSILWRRSKLAPITTSDWTATARCPSCSRVLIVYRMGPEREGFYHLYSDDHRNEPHHLGIIRTYVLCRAAMIHAAQYASALCQHCVRGRGA